VTSGDSPILIAGNGAPSRSRDWLALDYRRSKAGRNVHVALPELVWALGHIPPRTLDLLEIAAYVYAADRYSSRGHSDAVEYSAWGRQFQFRIRVRDHRFWRSTRVRKALSSVLGFLTGDAGYDFEFYPGHSTPPTSLFDVPGGFDSPASPASVALFSGGLDSLAGAIEYLSSCRDRLILVSHQSRPGTKHTQASLVGALRQHYGGRCSHYRFECNLSNVRAQEETQRSRFFLYGAVAFAVAQAFGQSGFAVFENGVTSINLARRPDLLHARASRTTHPQALRRMEEFLSEVAGAGITITTPYLFSTKRDVVARLMKGEHPELIASSVSCSRTFRLLANTTHCGECFQCVDRRLAVYAAGAEEHDHQGLYAADVIRAGFSGRDAKTTAVDYLRQAVELAETGLDRFHDNYVGELADVVPFVPAPQRENERVECLWRLFRSHGQGVLEALGRIRALHDDLKTIPVGESLLGVISEREYLRSSDVRLVEALVKILEDAVPRMFRGRPPEDEPDFNQKLSGLLSTHHERLTSEHPTASFGCARVIPDHELEGTNILIEAKYVRGNTTPSKVTDGIAADLTKYPAKAHILFVVLDPEGRIPDDKTLRRDVEGKGRCTVLILR
jgi:REase_DpnII-MboI